MLTAAELDSMRADVNASLPDTCAVVRPSTTVDSTGALVEGVPTTVATVACRISPSIRVPEEAIAAGRVGNVTPWNLTLPAGTDVSAGDRISSDGRAFEVVADLAPRSFEVSVRVVCVEVV